MRQVARSVAALAPVMAALLLSPGAAAQRAWQPPIDPPTPTGSALQDLDFSLTDRDEAVVAYTRSPGEGLPTVFATWRAPGGSFAPAQELGIRGFSPTVAADADGGALVAWEHEPPEGEFQRRQRILVASRPAGGSFGPPADVGQGQGGIALDANARGDAAVFWIRYGAREDWRELWAAVRTPAGTWGPPELVSGRIPENLYVHRHDVAVDAVGGVYFTWVEPRPGQGDLVKAAYRPPGGPVGDRQTLSDPGRAAFLPRVAADGRGGAAVAWVEAGAKHHFGGPLFASVAQPGGRFGPRTQLGDAGAQAQEGPQIAVSDGGEAVIAFAQAASSGDGGGGTSGPARAVVGSTVTGSWTPPVTLTRGYGAALDVALAMRPGGEALVVHDDTRSPELRSVRRPPGGDFGEPQVLGCAGVHATPLAAGLGSSGDGYALWLSHGDRVAHLSVEAAAASPNPATCDQPPGPKPTPAPPPGPGLVARGPARLTSSGRLSIVVACEAMCRVSAKGSLTVSGRRKRIPVTLSRGPKVNGSQTVKIRLARADALVVRRALTARRKVSARLWVKGVTSAGRGQRTLFAERLQAPPKRRR